MPPCIAAILNVAVKQNNIKTMTFTKTFLFPEKHSCFQE